MTLRIGARGTDEAPLVLRSLFFAEGLLALDWQGRPTARLATDWQWEDDGLTLRVHVRPGVRFHDGGPVNADTVRAILEQKVADPKTTGFESLKDIEAADPQTLLFHLKSPDGFLPSNLASTLIIDNKKPDIGTGPFRLVPGSVPLEAVRNTSYYRSEPGIEPIKRIQLIPYPTPRASWAGLMRGKADMALEISRESVEFLEGAARFETYQSLQPFYIPLVFNVRNPILAHAEVRRALADAINREEILSQGLRDQGVVAEDPIWPYHWAYNAAARRHTYNPNAARVRLDAAGFPVRPAGPGHRASRFQLKCAFYSLDPQFERIALLLQRQLAAVGVDLVLEGLNGTELKARLAKGQFDSYLFQHTSGRDVTWTYSFWHSPSGAVGPVFQNTGYTGADAALDRLRSAREDDDVRIAIGDLRQRFYEDVPAVVLAWTQTTRAVDARFDLGPRSDPEIFANLWRWRVATPTQAASR